MRPRDITSQIRVHGISASIENEPILIDESDQLSFRFRTPKFTAIATIEMPPITEDEVWRIGWIQACHNLRFINSYGAIGKSSWEAPNLRCSQYTCDSNEADFPWYRSEPAVATITGPKETKTMATVVMDADFFATVAWNPPELERSEKIGLTNIMREQCSKTWLVARNENTGRIITLRSIDWEMYVNIQIDPEAAEGFRAQVVNDGDQKRPQIRQESGDIPETALRRPTLKRNQRLIWQPTGKLPMVVIPSQETTLDARLVEILEKEVNMKSSE